MNVVDTATARLRGAGVRADGVHYLANCFTIDSRIADSALEWGADVIVFGSKRRRVLPRFGTGMRERVTALHRPAHPHRSRTTQVRAQSWPWLEPDVGDRGDDRQLTGGPPGPERAPGCDGPVRHPGHLALLRGRTVRSHARRRPRGRAARAPPMPRWQSTRQVAPDLESQRLCAPEAIGQFALVLGDRRPFGDGVDSDLEVDIARRRPPRPHARPASLDSLIGRPGRWRRRGSPTTSAPCHCKPLRGGRQLAEDRVVPTLCGQFNFLHRSLWSPSLARRRRGRRPGAGDRDRRPGRAAQSSATQVRIAAFSGASHG